MSLRLAVLASIACVLGMAAIVAALSGCGPALAAIDDAHDPALSVGLAKCRGELRDAKDAGADAQAAYDVYEACKKREGVDK